MCSTSDPSGALRAADPHQWVPFPQEGEGEEICDVCGARPGTLEAAGPCDEPEPAADADNPPEPWEFWPGDHYDEMPGFDRPESAQPPA